MSEAATNRADPAVFPNLNVSRHPLVRHKLTMVCDERTEPKVFRELVRELTPLLLYEATADLPLQPVRFRTPLEETEGAKIGVRIGLVPILRAGLGMVDAFLTLVPSAEVWHLGLYRDEETLQPVEYYNRISDKRPPTGREAEVWFVLDPMLATGGSAVAAIDVLKRRANPRIKYLVLIAAPEGVRALEAAHPDVDIHVAALDSHLNEHGYIVPGLGDAGDRQFGT